MRAKFLILLAAAVCTLLLCTSCGDDPLTEPGTPPVSTIVINPEPDTIGAPWQLTGPGDFSQSGIGDLTLTAVDPGEYTLTWSEVTGWLTPEPATATRTLTAGATLTFGALYTVQPRTITIDPVPDGANAPWELSGPDGYSLAGNGNLALPNMAPGEYSLTWGAAAGWGTPDPATVTGSLTAEGSLTFTGIYAIILELQNIPAGSFLMGSLPEEPAHGDDEARHEVTLSRGFRMLTREVTERQWYAVMGGSTTLSQLPMADVTWDGAMRFCNELSRLQHLTPAYTSVADTVWTWDREADGFRLPTEAEWEYACRAGSTEAFTDGPLTNPGCEPSDPNLDAVAWYCGNSGIGDDDFRHPVGEKQANAWGLFDMHGNVAEWCWDWYGAYGEEPVADPAGPETGHYRVIRGGDFTSHAQDCRSARRYPYYLDWPILSLGLRVVRSDTD